MRRGLLISVGLVLISLLACAPPPRGQAAASAQSSSMSDNLTAVIADIESVQLRLQTEGISAARSLSHDVVVLTRAINDKSVDPDTVLVLKGYRAQAGQIIVNLGLAMGLPTDKELATAAIADYQAIIDAPDGDEVRRAMKLHAMYGIASLKLVAFEDETGGYRQMKQCADLGYPSCMYMVAEAMVAGVEGIAANPRAALDLHTKVYDEAYDDPCIRSESAASNARISYFMGIKAENRSGLDWLRRARRVADEAKVRASNVDICGGSHLQIDEYLMRLEEGDRQLSLVRDLPKEDPSSTMTGVLVGYLMDEEEDKDAFKKAVGAVKNPYMKCEYAFLGLWKAGASKRSSDVQAYWSLMQPGKDGNACAQKLLFARKFVR